jgi:hypothetical protein
MSDQTIIEDKINISVLRRMALVALVLMLIGVTMLTAGIVLAFGVPAGLISLGAVLLIGGIVLGTTS